MLLLYDFLTIIIFQSKCFSNSNFQTKKLLPFRSNQRNTVDRFILIMKRMNPDLKRKRIFQWKCL